LAERVALSKEEFVSEMTAL
jgi:hypothetical protein